MLLNLVNKMNFKAMHYNVVEDDIDEKYSMEVALSSPQISTYCPKRCRDDLDDGYLSDSESEMSSGRRKMKKLVEEDFQLLRLDSSESVENNRNIKKSMRKYSRMDESRDQSLPFLSHKRCSNPADEIVDEIIRKSRRMTMERGMEEFNEGWETVPASIGPDPRTDMKLSTYMSLISVNQEKTEKNKYENDEPENRLVDACRLAGSTSHAECFLDDSEVIGDNNDNRIDEDIELTQNYIRNTTKYAAGNVMNQKRSQSRFSNDDASYENNSSDEEDIVDVITR